MEKLYSNAEIMLMMDNELIEEFTVIEDMQGNHLIYMNGFFNQYLDEEDIVFGEGDYWTILGVDMDYKDACADCVCKACEEGMNDPCD